jgi:hypothetical protein
LVAFAPALFRIVVNDLAAATAFFVKLGLKPQGEGSVVSPLLHRRF